MFTFCYSETETKKAFADLRESPSPPYQGFTRHLISSGRISLMSPPRLEGALLKSELGICAGSGVPFRHVIAGGRQRAPPRRGVNTTCPKNQSECMAEAACRMNKNGYNIKVI